MNNFATFVIASVIAIIFFSIVIKGILNIKNGKTSCSCGCSGCASKDICHKKQSLN